LWLRDLSFSKSEHDTARTIVGLVDDDTSLHARWVYGFPVLGGRQDLPGLIARHHITGIVVTADLKTESRASVLELARRLEIELSEWTSSERVLIPRPVDQDSRAGVEPKMAA
jgi:FlaA1/EpsC-like NDP-sugar epimerase